MLSGSSWHKWRRTLLALFFIVQYHCRMTFLSLRYKLHTIPRPEIATQAYHNWHKLCDALTSHKALNAVYTTSQSPKEKPENEQFTDVKQKTTENEQLINEQFTGAFHTLKQKTVENEQITGAIRVLKAKTVENEQITGAIRVLKAKTVENEQITGSIHVLKQIAESERLHAALHTAKKRLEEIVFVEETPTEPIDLSTLEKLKSAWHSLETGKIPRLAPEALKAARHSLTTGKIPRITPETLEAAKHPLKTLKKARNNPLALITLGLTALILISLFAVSGMANRTLHSVQRLGPAGLSQLVSSELNVAAQQAPAVNASQALMRISQLDESEYASQDEYDTWAYSACSTAAMTEVFNAYGHHYRITDVLKVESAIGAITPQLGLLHDSDVAKTAAWFGFQTNWGEGWTLDQVLSYANAGQPVLVGWPPDRYDGGHIVVVTGGDANNVYLADSSLWNRHEISRAQFMQWWEGFAAVVTPQ